MIHPMSAKEKLGGVFAGWVTPKVPERKLPVTVLQEDAKKEAAVVKKICEAVVNNLMSEAIQKLDTQKRFPVLVNLLAKSSRARSGDFGEVMATEYVSNLAEYPIFIRRLRFKDIGNLSMRGDDVLAFRANNRGNAEALKVESKAKARISKTTLNAAHENLNQHDGRPNPHSLAFIVSRLREENRDGEAEIVDQLLIRAIAISRVRHLVFATCGNDPTKILCEAAKTDKKKIACDYVGLHVVDYPQLVKTIFENLNGAHK